MIQLVTCLIQDYIYNIIDSDELYIPHPETLKLWDNLGFTKGLPEEGEIICSNAFDAMIKYLLHYTENTPVNIDDVEICWSRQHSYANEYDDLYTAVCFPMIRRLYVYGVVLEPWRLYNLYTKVFPSLLEKFEKMKEYGLTIDVEAEAISLFCKIITKRVKKNKKKKKEKI